MSETELDRGDVGGLILGLIVALLLAGFVWVYVFAMPKWAGEMAEWEVELPQLTILVLAASFWIRANWLLLLPASLIVGIPPLAFGRGATRMAVLVVLALILLLLLTAGLAGVYLPAQRLRAIQGPAPAGPF